MAELHNPMVPGFNPDPSVVRVDGAYYLVTSSFEYLPGLPVYRSADLVDWEHIGNVATREPQIGVADVPAGLGVWAPTIRHRDGKFHVIVTVNSGRGCVLFTAEDPAGAWSDGLPLGIDGIDPDLAWDVDGTAYVTYAGPSGIEQVRVDLERGAVLEPPRRLWSGTGLQYPESPHLYRRDDTWYLLIAEGGTERGHAASIARGPSPIGPWEGCPANPILSHRSTDEPIQNTGHADLVEATDGSSWMTFLGIRPRGVTPGFHVLGRETFLAPVTWQDGWPVVGAAELEVATRPPGPIDPVLTPVRDDFDGSALHPRWISVRRPPDEVASLSARPGWLTLLGGPASLADPQPVFVGRRQQHPHCRVRGLIDAGSSLEAGLVIRMDESSHYEIAVTADRIIARACIGPLQQVVGDAPRSDGAIVLSIETAPRHDGPDTIVLGHQDAAGEARAILNQGDRERGIRCDPRPRPGAGQRPRAADVRKRGGRADHDDDFV